MVQSPLSVLFLYNATQTFTNTVWEHLASFKVSSRHRVFFAHVDPASVFDLDLEYFDVVIIHYTIRLPYDQVPDTWAEALRSFSGVKAVFQQDEYDLTDKIRAWLERLEIDVMFTCVPEGRVSEIYDPARFPRTRFVSNLTGYVPSDIAKLPPPVPLADRRVLIGYRGRPLAYWYGVLGQEKTLIAKRMRAECEDRYLPVDIEWVEEARIYGDGWYEFLRHCRAVLGTESGSNLFDDDGSIRSAVAEALKENRRLSYEEVERRFFPGKDKPGLMNQVSPRIFEAVALRVALVLFEGEYSNVVTPGEHYIALKKDFSNVDEVLRLLQDDEYVERLTRKAFDDVILSGRYGYPRFVNMVDEVLEEAAAGVDHDQSTNGRVNGRDLPSDAPQPTLLSTSPLRALPPTPEQMRVNRTLMILAPIWGRLPQGLRNRLKPKARKFVRMVRGF